MAGRRVFVSIARPLSVTLLFSLRNALSLPDAQVYYGVPKPDGDVVTSPYIEARNDLLSAEVVVVILAETDDGQISDDWTLNFRRQLDETVPVLVYLCRTESRDENLLPASTFDTKTATLKHIATEAQIIPLVVADIFRLLGGDLLI